jgi:peptidoglycan hydrolase-like protein with peptidoglycan-binding domain
MHSGHLTQQTRCRTALSFLITAVIALTGAEKATAEQIGPSFDCHAAQQPLAQLLCSDPGLSRTDLRFTQAYFALLKQVGEAGKRELKQEDLQFLEAVQRQCGIPASGQAAPQSEASRNCVKSAYEAQRAVWVLRLTPPFAEEANRPIERHVALQSLLQQLGFLPADAAIDGVYGAGTRDAISKWQSAHGRNIIGVLPDSDAQALEQQAPQSRTTAIDQPRPQNEPSTQENVQTSPGTGNSCKVSAPAPTTIQQKNVENEWKGGCRAGKAEGTGLLKWYSEGIEFLTEDFTERNGAVVKQGVAAAMDSTLTTASKWDATCNEIPVNYSNGESGELVQNYIVNDLSPEISLGLRVVVDRLLSMAEEIARKPKECKIKSMYHGRKTFLEIEFRIRQNGRAVFFARYSNNNWENTAGGFQNQVFSDTQRKAFERWSGEKARREAEHYAAMEKVRREVEEARAREEAARVAEAQRAQRESERARLAEQQRQINERAAASLVQYNEFVKRAGIQDWPSLDDLVANPFAYEGKTIGLWGSFSQMVARDRGIFAGKVLLSSLPIDAVKNGAQTLVAGKVLGNELVDTPFGGKIPLPLLKFVDIYKCQQTNCEDAMFWKTNLR